MNWEQFQTGAAKLTQEEIRKLSLQVLEIYQSAYNDIVKALESQYAKLTGVKPEDYYNEMMKFNRLEKLQKEIRTMYYSYASKSDLIIENISFVAFSNSYYREQYMASWLSSFDVGILPYQLAEFTVYGTAESWKRITTNIENIYGNVSNYKSKGGTLLDLLTKNKTEELAKIQNAITQGLLQGKSYKATSEQIKVLIGDTRVDKAGKVTTTGSSANAMRIIRTESNRTYNAGHYAGSKYLDSIGLKVKRRLVSVLDNRTRAQSAMMDGDEVGVDQPFKYPGGVTGMYPGTTGVPAYDINDRESVIDIINDNGPEIRSGRNPIEYLPNGEKNPDYGKNETFTHKYFSEWAKEQGLIKNKYGEVLFPKGK